MKIAACKFWTLEEEQFTLVLPNNHEIMSLNGNKDHMGFFVHRYFEIFKEKRPLIHLVRPNRERIPELHAVPKEEKILIKIPW